ncbi:MAG: rod shape-determining protein [Clostridia bacterium]|nr:rod shape-determining protein [Clostridia bacterium]
MLAKKIGLDVGTYSLKVCADFRDAIDEIPCTAAVDTLSGSLLGYGDAVRSMRGRAPYSYQMKSFIRSGAVNDFGLAVRVLGDVFDRMLGQRVLRPAVVACVGVGATELEKKMLLDVLHEAGAARAFLVSSAVASSIGYYGPSARPEGRAVLDVGAGAADFAVVTMNGVAARKAVPAAGIEMTKALTAYLSEERGVVLGEEETERLKRALACVYPREPELAFVAGGKKANGEAVSFELTSTEVSKALRGCFDRIGRLIISVLEETPPELVGDVRKNGILLTGGCAVIPGLEAFLTRSVGVSVTCPRQPAYCAIRGVKRLLPGFKAPQAERTLYEA